MKIHLQDFDLCVNCYSKGSHQHEMFKSGFDIDDNYDENKMNENGETNPQEARLQSIQRCIHSLVHACQCRDANCRLPSCQKMKRVVSHTRTCKRKKSSGCPVCKQLIALCCYHAKHCMVSYYFILIFVQIYYSIDNETNYVILIIN